MNKREAISKEREVIEKIAKILQEVYGHYWNFEIDFSEGDVTKNYVLKIKIYKR